MGGQSTMGPLLVVSLAASDSQVIADTFKTRDRDRMNAHTLHTPVLSSTNAVAVPYTPGKKVAKREGLKNAAQLALGIALV